MMNKKGLTIVEIVVSIGLISIVIVFLFQVILTIKNVNDRQNNKTDTLITTTIITREVEKDLNSFGLDNNVTNNIIVGDECIQTSDDDFRNNIIPNTATNTKCVKIIYDSSNVKNNEGYILYYQNDKKNFLAYKRGKNNIIETQTIREISVSPDDNTIKISKETSSNAFYSLKITIPIRQNNDRYDMIINYINNNM